MLGRLLRRNFSSEFKNIKTSIKDKVALVELNRPKALNALNLELMDELGKALRNFQADKEVGAVVITGSEKSFAGKL